MHLGRAMLIDSKLPSMFYAEAQLTAAYLYNRMVHGNNSITPYEHIYGRPPNVSHLRPFGTICYAFIPPELRDKLEPSGVRCRLLGYLDDDDTEECKGYKLLNEATLEIIMTDDVRFDLGVPMIPLPDYDLYDDDIQGEDVFGDPTFHLEKDDSDTESDFDADTDCEEPQTTHRTLRSHTRV